MGGLKIDITHNRDARVISNFREVQASDKGSALFKKSPNVVTEGIKVIDDPKGKTVLRVFDKKKFEKAMDTASLIVTVKGIVKAIVGSIGAIWGAIKKSTPQAFKDFTKTWGFIPDGIELGPAVYGLYDDGVHLVKAVRNGDEEEIKDRSVGVSTATMTVAGNAIGFAAYVEAGKSSSAAAQGATLGVAAGALGCVVWGITAIVQAISIRRIWKRISKIRNVFHSAIEKENEKILRGIREVKSQLELSEKEELKLKAKAKGDFGALKKARAKLLEAKVNKFKKRVGEENTEKIKAQIFTLSNEIDKSGGHLDPMLLGRAKRIMKTYKRSLNREISLNIMKFAGAVIGFVGAVVAFSNPIGAGVLAGVAAGIMIYSWYKSNYSKIDEYKKITLFGIKTNLLDYEIDAMDTIPYVEAEEEESLLAKRTMIESEGVYAEIGGYDQKKASLNRKTKKKLDKDKVVALDTYRVVAADTEEVPDSLKPKRVSREEEPHTIALNPHEIEKERYKALMKRIHEENARIYSGVTAY